MEKQTRHPDLKRSLPVLTNRLQIIFWIGIAALLYFPVFAQNSRDVYGDSIMSLVLDRAGMYQEYIRTYEANLYIKGTSDVLKKNILLRFAPNFLTIDKKNDHTLLEVLVDLSYKEPNHFKQKITALNGTTLDPDFIQHQAMQFLNINIYNPTSFSNEILMPVANHAFKYYYFFHEGCMDTLNQSIHKIRIEPKIFSQKLISGYLFIVDQTYNIAKADMQGKFDFATFHVITDFGTDPQNFLLPAKTELNLQLKLLGNHINNHYFSAYQYTTIEKYIEPNTHKMPVNYDLTDHYNVEMDSLPIVTDSLYWKEHRPFPLTIAEQNIYQKSREQKQTAIDSLNPLMEKLSWNFAKGIIAPKRFGYKSSDMRYSGLINPFKLAYSKQDGFVYWQQLKIQRKAQRSGREMSFNPSVGFVFSRKEMYGKLPVSWLYNPGHMGALTASIGNGNQAYSSKAIQEINEQLRDSSFSFEDLNLQYYKHYYLSLSNQNELANGLLCNFGIDYHLYDPVQNSVDINTGQRLRLDDGISDLVTENYSSLTPVINLTWTPNQYYRYNGKRKEYVGSQWPTLSIEYARGIPNIFGSNSKYERIEGDIQQRIQLEMLRSFQYYCGGGVFTNTSSVYFADFHKFARRNFPQSWDDKIGGVFQLLDGNWYNASNSYAQFHAMYESPLMILRIFKRLTKDIVKERFYFSQLYTPALPSYTEFGYGAGNFLFNAGIFVSFNKGAYESFGFKFAFEL